jgi:hypothetical protein
VDCPSVANAVQTCSASACGFECNPGYTKSGNGCVQTGGADAGAKAGDGDACSTGSDCASGVCGNAHCQPARCDDGTKNGRETDIDCGGNCAPCAQSQHCGVDADCNDGPCTGGVCGCTPYACDHPALAGQCGDALPDHCGGTVSCGCGSGETCYQGACCNPESACTNACGDVSACGTTINCGMASCAGTQTCFQSKCCTAATTCATDACGNVDDGCGGTIPCGSCTNGRVCQSNKCQCDNTDTDGDGLTDCQEFDDGDPWTDSTIWNGLVGTTYDNCNSNAQCTAIDTNAKVDTCTSNTVVETHNLSSGWGFTDTAAARCDAAYGFKPNWTQSCSDTSFSVAYTGSIYLQAGTHCFDIAGGNGGLFGGAGPVCGVFFLDGDDTKMVSNDSNAKCFNVSEGPHTVRLFFDRTGGLFPPLLGFNWEHCFGGASTCTPTQTVKQQELRVK